MLLVALGSCALALGVIFGCALGILAALRHRRATDAGLMAVTMLGTSIPLLMNFATTHGLDPLAVGMIWTFASGGKIFVYQSAVMIVGYSYGYFDGRDMLRIGLALTVIESVLLLLVVPFYWPLIGI